MGSAGRLAEVQRSVSMVKVIVATPFQPQDKSLQQIEQLGFSVIPYSRQVGLTAEMSEAEVAVCTPDFLQNHLHQLPGLKLIQLCTTGYEAAPIQQIEERKIIMCNARGVMSIPIAEWVVLKILELYKNTRFFLEAQKQRSWAKNMNQLELNGKTVCIVGTGSIGCEVAKRLAAFGCHLIGVDIRQTQLEVFDRYCPVSEFAAALRQSDIVVLTLPYNAQTRHLINEKTLAECKEGAILLNVSRGGIVDEAALLAALNTGRLRGAALDVFEQEPLPVNSPLWQHERVLVTPHIAFTSENFLPRLWTLILTNLQAYASNQPLQNIVTGKEN